MTVTVTDLFCGAGGSSVGAEQAGATIELAMNHWQTAIDVHQPHFPNAKHDCADISQADPRRYPRTNILIAGPECTNHSQARGVSRKAQQPGFFDAPDPAAERSRATMWDVVRFAEQMHYEAIVVENVIEATKWILWPAWRKALEDLGYTLTLLSHNSMHHAVPQSRDRIYCVWLRNGLTANLEMELAAWCLKCSDARTVRQAWKNGRTAGRYRQQWYWSCTTCGASCETVTEPAAKIIDWSLDCPRIGDRARPLASATRERILAGLQRYGWAPITTAGAGNVYEQTPGNRARSVGEPLATQHATSTTALATPPGFTMNTAHGGRLYDVDDPHPTVCASDDRLSLVVQLRGTDRGQIATSARSANEPLGTVSAGGQHHAIVVTNNPNNVAHSADEPLAAVTTSGNRHGLIVSPYGNGGVGDQVRRVKHTDEPLPTLTTTTRPALLMRNNGTNGEPWAITPIDEPARSMTTKGHQSLLMPEVGTIDLDAIVDDCGFRMLEPHEVAAAMAFPVGYIPRSLPKVHQVKLAGNAVTPPVMRWIMGRVIQALEALA